jgi:hypothetical protein
MVDWIDLAQDKRPTLGSFERTDVPPEYVKLGKFLNQMSVC